MANLKGCKSRLSNSMNRCDEIRANLALYLDDELDGGERTILETHLRDCEACREVVESERVFLRAIRESHPLHVASPDLRLRVEGTLRNAPAPVLAPLHSRQRIRKGLGQLNPNHGRLAKRVSLVAAAIVILILPGVIWRLTSHSNDRAVNAPSNFALMAAESHLRHTRGQLPLEVVSDAPEQISDWFANKVRFSVKLPNYQESSGQEKLYRLEGARLVGYKDDYAAYVAYQMRRRPIGLVITSNEVARPSGGEEIQARGLVFHYDAIQGLKVITWSDRGLTYALVSDLDERGQESCMVCHQGTRDQDFIAPLKPR
jgi:anti-sigma factor RsiW